MAHVAEWKKEEVKELIEIINGHEVIGIVDLMNIPAKQLQEMRKNLKQDAVIRMAKKNLIDLALEDCNADKTNIVDLSEHMDGQIAIIATDMNPFKLYKILEKSKTSAPAKAGAIAPDDIVVPEGDTGITNLAFMGELGQVGIQARPQDGKIFIAKETVVVPAGEEVSKQMAATLTRLDINPMEVGIDLKAVYEEGSVYTSDVLAIDEEQTLADLQNAFRNAFNLSVNAAIPTEETTSTIITLAYTRAINVGVAGAIMTAETSEPLIGLAQAKMMAIASEVSGVEGALSEALAEKLSNVAVAAAPAAEEVAEEEVVEEEEEDKEDNGDNMEYIYAAMILHSAEKDINEENVKSIIEAAGIEADEARIKALIAALEDVDIDEAMETTAMAAAAPAAAPAAAEVVEEEEEEEEEEEASEEVAAAGLGALFG